MEFHLFPTLTFLSLVVVEIHASLRSELHWPLVLPNTPETMFCRFSCAPVEAVASDADLPSEIYWNSVLPNTPMPQAIKKSLRPDLLAGENTWTRIGKSVITGLKGDAFNYGYDDAEDQLHLDPNLALGVKVNPEDSPSFAYGYDASKAQVHAYPNVALFFLEKDLSPGTKMNLHFTKTSNAAFLPHQVANSIPFSSDKLPEILDIFSMKPESLQAEAIKNTIQECEETTIKGEEKHCVTSLESMIDFSTAKLGKDVIAISTEAESKSQMQYTIEDGVEKMGGEISVVCHKRDYAYAVFYCHKNQATRAYVVPLVGNDGTKARAVAVCHTNTMEWNHKHLAFQVLKVKPGTTPICHFLPEDHLIWIQKSAK